MSRTLWLLVALFIVYGTTMPFHVDADRAAIGRKVAGLSWNPLTRDDGRRVSIPDTVQNVMLFLPFGALGALTWRRRFSSRMVCVGLVTLAAAALSGLVETLQLFTVDRVASVSDVATNTLGGLAGAVVAVRGRDWSLAMLRQHGAAGWLANRWAYPALVAGITLVVSAWQPFDLTLDVGSVVSKVRALGVDPWQGGPLTDEGNALLLYALGAMVISAWLEDSGLVRRRTSVFLIISALTVGLELSQVFVGSRMPSGRDALVRVAGVAAGMAIGPAVIRSRNPRPWLGLLVLATILCAGLANLSPFTVAGTQRAFSWFPFLGYYDSNWFPTVSHVIEVMLLYFPLGYCIGLTRRKSLRVALAFVASIVIATEIELLQSWIVGRYADITDVAVSALGGAMGAWVSTGGAELFERARTANNQQRSTNN